MKWCLLAVLAAGTLAAANDGVERLYRGFQDPSREYTVRPFWFWNGRLDARELEWQISQMVAQGVYGAYVHNRTGLETPYLSEEYFQAVGAAFRKAREAGFLLGFVDEYEWPSGEARDVWQRGLPSRVIAANPEFRMRTLAYAEKEVSGPRSVNVARVEGFQFAVAAPLRDGGAIDADSLVEVPTGAWAVPAGRWLLWTFYLRPAQGADGGMVDLLNSAAIRKFLDLTYEQYYKRFGEYYGRTIDSTYQDHEGDYGLRIAWTPALFETFRKLKGYDLRTQLPLLFHDGGRRTPKVRCDYLDVISELYCDAFFRQVTGWGTAHGIQVTGHIWEERLQTEAAYEGDLQRIMRSWGWPGVDSLHDRGRLPRDFKAAASVAHFRGTRFTCENQGLQGAESYLDFQKMRLGTNMIAAWGVNSFIPHAFNYNRQRIEYPPDWFYHEPYWKYFKHYADYARRISYMNAGGRHVADVLLFQPTESAWANSEPLFDAAQPYIPRKFDNPLEMINDYYTRIMNGLAEQRWDFDVADSYFLEQAEIRDGRLHIGNESFRALVLPPMTTIRRSTLRKICQFRDQGGIVIGVRLLPSDSTEEGRNDPVIAAEAPRMTSFFVKEDVSEISRILAANLDQDVKARGDHLFYLHRQKEGADFYWLVNDSDQPRDVTLALRAKGAAEKWDAETAERSPVAQRALPGGTEVRVHFDPWDAFYVVFGAEAAKPAPQPQSLPAIELGGRWSFEPESKELPAPYAENASGNIWLSRERLAVKDWWIIGPFANDDHRGFREVYPPEKSVDLTASYGRLKWKRHTSDSYAVNLEKVVGQGNGWATSYAVTYLYSPSPRRVEFRIAASNNAKLWVNGRNLLDWHIHPFYYEMREDFALSREGDLEAGWNEVLVKISRCGRGQYGFFLRVTDGQGRYLDDVVVSAARERQVHQVPGKTTYRIPVPVSAVGIRLPRFSHPVTVRSKGERLQPDAEGVVRFSGEARTLELETDAAEVIRDEPVFLLGRTSIELGSWTTGGLPYYSGSARYERDFEFPPKLAAKKILLDCGQVGVVAEVWVNDRPAGVRVWLPYTFDITKLVRPGQNRLRILVTNTMENARAVENHAAKLEKIQLNGLLGPVRIVPYR